jgi:hypothetical protein
MTTNDDGVIEGLKLIRHNMGGVDDPDDPTYPFRLEATFCVPEFMQVTNALLYGCEKIVVRGQTREALERFVELNRLRQHPRLIRIDITG